MFTCSHQLLAQPTAAEWFDALNLALNTNVSDTFWGYTHRQVLESSLFSGGSGTKIRITLEASTSFPLNVADGLYIQEQAASGDPYDYASAPAQLQVGGSNTFTVPIGSSQVTDELTFAWDPSKNYVIAIDNGSGTSSPNFGMRGLATLSGASLYRISGSDGTTIDPSGYSTATENLGGIQKIEVFG